MDVPRAKIGDPIGEPAPSVYELIVTDHVKYVDPTHYGLTEKSVRPLDYFITSGDAIEKTKILERDLWDLAGALRKKCYNIIAEENNCSYAQAQNLYRDGIRPIYPPNLKTYEEEIWKAAGSSRKLLNALKKAKGTNIFLETEWESHKLLVIPKNPRRANQ